MSYCTLLGDFFVSYDCNMNSLKRFGRRPMVLAVLVVLLALGMRLPGLGHFMTADEEQWMLRSGVFWHELFRQGDASGTFLTTHPGATTMWLTGAGVAFQEVRVGVDIDTSNLRHFRLAATRSEERRVGKECR